MTLKRLIAHVMQDSYYVGINAILTRQTELLTPEYFIKISNDSKTPITCRMRH